MIRILVVNPNTDERMTAALAAAAQAACPQGLAEIDAITVPFGPPLLTRRRDVAVAGAAVLGAVSQHADRADAVVIGSFSDPGLEAAREILAVPVVALCEASALAACQLGARIGMILSAPSMVPAIEEKLRAYGLAQRVCGIRTPADPAAAAAAGRAAMIDAYVALGAALVEEARAEVLVLGGGPLIGCAPDFQQRLPVPVIDSVECAVLQAFLLARLKARKPARGSYSQPPAIAGAQMPAALARIYPGTG